MRIISYFCYQLYAKSAFARNQQTCTIKKLVLTIHNIHRKTPVLEFPFNKIAGNTSVFLPILRIFKNTFFTEHLRISTLFTERGIIILVTQ